MSKQTAKAMYYLILFYFALGLILLAFILVYREGVDGVFPSLISGIIGYNLLEYLEEV
ncbi:hypothetical protein [Spartinivicinus ruber]|uniref:hypothetical protein n=1 Tax=Spartinivicinus ruber TaxID=2683272 RepID=UPI0013D5A735|nr:hypothetical protein [Spartinivicinus ruber]